MCITFVFGNFAKLLVLTVFFCMCLYMKSLRFSTYKIMSSGEYNKHAQLWMESVHCQLVGSLAILSTEVSILLLTFLTLEKYICIVYPFRYLRPRKYRTITVLILIWITGFIVAFVPLSNKEFFKNCYGTSGVCFPLHSEDTESVGAQIYSVTIFLGKKFCIISSFI